MILSNVSIIVQRESDRSTREKALLNIVKVALLVESLDDDKLEVMKIEVLDLRD